jgi:GAF domain-containing protein
VKYGGDTESFEARPWRRQRDGFPGEDERHATAVVRTTWLRDRRGARRPDEVRRTGHPVGPSHEEERIAEVLVQMGGVLLSELTVDRILQLVTELAERSVRSAAAVSVTLMHGGKPDTPNASEAVARDLDEVQYKSGEGPCLDALHDGHVVNCSLDGTGRGRWPAFTEAARLNGMESVLSVPMMVGERSLGALNIYSRSREPYDEAEATTASLLAQQAAAVLANAVAYADVHTLNSQLRDALDSRDLIGQAKGILMERESCNAEAAFDILRRASQRTNTKLRDVAAELIGSVTNRDHV